MGIWVTDHIQRSFVRPEGMQFGLISAWLYFSAGFLLRVFDDPAKVIGERSDFCLLGVFIKQRQGVSEKIGGGLFRDEQVILQLLLCRVVADGAVSGGEVVGELLRCLVIDLLGMGRPPVSSLTYHYEIPLFPTRAYRTVGNGRYLFTDSSRFKPVYFEFKPFTFRTAGAQMIDQCVQVLHTAPLSQGFITQMYYIIHGLYISE